MYKWIGDKSRFLNRIFVLERKAAKTKRCKRLDEDLDAVFREIKEYLPEDKQNLTMKIEDCFTHLLILHEEYFYVHGYSDGKRRLLGDFRRTGRKMKDNSGIRLGAHMIKGMSCLGVALMLMFQTGL